jgi:hypothetical protein
MMSFRLYVLLREGLFLPDRPPRPRLDRINTTPFQDIRRTSIFRPRRVKVARTPTVRLARVPRVPKVTVA